MNQRRIQLSLRDLFWLVLVCALGIGWWNENARASKEREALRQEREAIEALRVENRNLLTALGGADAMLQDAADQLYPLKKPE